MFDSNAENPELIWNNNTRENVRNTLNDIQNELVISQMADPTKKWNIVIFFKIKFNINLFF